MNENVKDGAKLAAHIVGGVCGAFTVGRVIGAFVPGVGTVGKAVMCIGASCMGGIVGTKCSEYLVEQVESICDAFDMISSKKVKEN